MRIFPFLGFVNSAEDQELSEFLGLDPARTWSIFLFEWLDYTYVFYAYTKPVK